MNVFQRIADQLLPYFSRPIYLTLVCYSIASIIFLVVAISYFSQRKAGEISISTQIAFWVLFLSLSCGFMKLVIELLIPKYRKQYFRVMDRTKRGNDPRRNRRGQSKIS